MTTGAPTLVRTRPAGRRGRKKVGKGGWMLMLLALPGIVWFALFCYLPLAGLVVAFKNFNISQGIFGSPWSGFQNFEYFLASGSAWTITFNTVFLNVLFLSGSLLAGLMLALMINEIRWTAFKRFSQSVIFFPYFVSPIVISIILQVVFAGVNGRGGAANNLFSVFGFPQVSWYTTPGPWPWILTLVKIWQLGGYTSVIFLAAITSISEEVYEAGALDGASRFRMARSITTPLLGPTIGILVVLGVGRIFFGDFATIYAIVGDNGTLFPTTDVIDTYVFRALRTLGDFGTTAAIGLFQSVIGFIFVAAALLVQRRFNKESSIL
ncbi:MAG: sugar transporter permease [Frondihabitans sp.]|nr:sugar transporter permease [Frondihabitans sp.]